MFKNKRYSGKPDVSFREATKREKGNARKLII